MKPRYQRVASIRFSTSDSGLRSSGFFLNYSNGI
jgi:hypothetical protein